MTKDRGFMSLCLMLSAFTAKSLALLGAIIGFGLLITIHELGHFAFCKLFGIHTPTFSIGMGPIIYKKRIGSTDFALSALPLGGYVEMAGLSEIAQGDQKSATVQDHTSFQQKPYWQKFLVLIGGITFNMLFAYLVFISLFAIGMPTMKQIDGIKIISIIQGSAAEKHGLKLNDQIIGADDITFAQQETYALKAFQELLQGNPHKTLEFRVLRENKTKKVKVTLEARNDNGTQIGMLGAGLEVINPTYAKERLPFIKAIKKGIESVNNISYNIIQSFKMMFKKKSIDGAGGPVMILAQSFSSAQQGLSYLLIFLAIISVNLAIMNLLPLGALDGGQLMFTTIEAIIRRPLPDIVRIIINVSSLVLFLGLAIYLTYYDILKLLGW